MNEEMMQFDRWIHWLELVIVLGIGLVVFTAKRKLGRGSD